jgi:hypothetical protein|tara:strand:+ start:4645 stop:4818 length:174 start_codon:yes stop_codon:yes gene_type:complete
MMEWSEDELRHILQTTCGVRGLAMPKMWGYKECGDTVVIEAVLDKLTIRVDRDGRVL